MPWDFLVNEPVVMNGKALSDLLVEEYASNVLGWAAMGQEAPGLATILVGSSPASETYVQIKRRRARQVGFQDIHSSLPEGTSEERLLQTIEGYNRDKSVHGILVQLPLPKGINTARVLESISPAKDVDGLHPVNLGRLAASSGLPHQVACTPKGILMLLQRYNIKTEGKNIAILGRSSLVGRPLSILLSQNNVAGNGTVTLLHSGSKNTKEHCRRADILIAAIGNPKTVRSDWVKEGACVIDVGINKVEEGSSSNNKLVGDVDYDSVRQVAGAITPVPGGVGPMTVAALLGNTIDAYERIITNKKPTEKRRPLP